MKARVLSPQLKNGLNNNYEQKQPALARPKTHNNIATGSIKCYKLIKYNSLWLHPHRMWKRQSLSTTFPFRPTHVIVRFDYHFTVSLRCYCHWLVDVPLQSIYWIFFFSDYRIKLHVWKVEGITFCKQPLDVEDLRNVSETSVTGTDFSTHQCHPIPKRKGTVDCFVYF